MTNDRWQMTEMNKGSGCCLYGFGDAWFFQLLVVPVAFGVVFGEDVPDDVSGEVLVFVLVFVLVLPGSPPSEAALPEPFALVADAAAGVELDFL
jgi:hypothetical protein